MGRDSGGVVVLLGVLLSFAGAPLLEAQVRTATLDEAVTSALQANPNVVQARGQLDVAGASRREAFGNWLPTINGTSGWSRNSSSRFDQATQRTVSGASNSYSAGFNASLELFDGFRRVALNRVAAADVESADASLVNQQFQVTLQTKQTFFTALAADELVRVAETRIQRADEQLKIAKDKLAAGSATRSDTLRARVELGNAQLQLLNAQTQRATAEADLARLMGIDGAVRATSDPNLFAPLELDTAQLREEALQASPLVGQAVADARAADAQIGVSRAQYFPSVTASFNNSWAGAAVSNLNNTWSLRLNLSWPLFNGFRRESNYASAAASQDAARARADDARRQVNADLTQYLAAIAAASARVEIAEASRAAADEDLRVLRERYRLGAATILDVLTSQVNLDQAEVDMVQARLDFLVARAQIEALIGREL
jgi:TolC family type I secretion outer membrane protein